jgi:lipid-A-disaccharide synthase
MPADIFLSAGEASGDLQASLLVGALRRQRADLSFAAVGGPRLRAAGASIVLDSVAQEWASIGHVRAYMKIPWLLSVMLGLSARLLASPPKLLVCVDFGAFNLRMLEWLRFCGYRGRAMYYFPPGAWLDNPQQARKVARVAAPLTPFAHQAMFYRNLGLPVEYFGHPLAGAIATRERRAVAQPPLIAVLPGSREEEVTLHLPILAAAAQRLAAERGTRFVVVAASDERSREIGAAWPQACGGAAAVVRGDAAEVVANADVAWVASGTAVLETALRGVPQIGFYRLTDVQYQMARKRVPHIVRGPITLPNLVTGENVVPELLQDDFNPDRLVEATRKLLDNDGARESQAAGYSKVRRALGPEDALERIAAYVAGLVPQTAATS